MIKIDLTNKTLNESWMKMWGFWNKKLLQHIYGEDTKIVANLNEEDSSSFHFSIKGEYEDVKAYAMALKAESDLLRAYIEHGKDAPETKEAKVKADAASKEFVEKNRSTMAI